MKIKLKNLKFNEELLYARKLEKYTISKYQQAYRAGKDLGKITINKKTKEIVSGNHRIKAMLKVFGPEHVINVSVKTFKSKTELLEFFIQENIEHGLPLQYQSKHILTRMLLEEGVDHKRTAQIFGVTMGRIVHWAGETVLIRDGTKTRVEVKKAGLDHVTEMTPKQHKEHDHDIGRAAIFQIKQLIRWCKNKWIDTEDKNLMKNIEILRDLFTDLLEEEMKGSPFIMKK